MPLGVGGEEGVLGDAACGSERVSREGPDNLNSGNKVLYHPT